MSGRLSRAERDALARRDAGLIAGPLAKPGAMEAHLRHAVGLLKSRQLASPSARLVAHLNEVYLRNIPPEAAAAIACRRGCVLCCSQAVLVFPPEAFAIAAQLRDRPGTAAAVNEAAFRIKDRPPETHASNWMRCPLLEGSDCSIYAARPLSCQAFVSLDLNDCIATFTLGAPSGVRTPKVHEDLRNACRMILVAALRLCGLPDTAYEMNMALAAVLAMENAEKHWLRGGNVLAGLPPVSPLAPNAAAAVQRLVAAVAPTL